MMHVCECIIVVVTVWVRSKELYYSNWELPIDAQTMA